MRRRAGCREECPVALEACTLTEITVGVAERAAQTLLGIAP